MAEGIPAGLIRRPWTAAEGRKFAFTVGTAFLVLAGVVWWREHLFVVRLFGGLGALLIAAGLVIPQHLKPVYRAWMRLALAISMVTTPILLGLIYFAVFTPVGLIRHTLGWNSLVQPLTDDSYWRSRVAGTRQSNLERQF